MNFKLLSFLIFSGFQCITSFAQSKSKFKFGDISEKDFNTKVYSIDSNANAVILADIGSSEIQGNDKSSFSLVFKKFQRVHILNKNGYDIASVSVPLYVDGSDEEKLDNVKAVTYNLENGKVVEYKLDVKSNIFKDKLNKNYIIKKFTLPNIKEGSIIEFQYTVTSDYIRHLQPWTFQGIYPCLWSEYNVAIPEFFRYVFLTQGYKTYDVTEKKERNESYRIMETRGAGATERFEFNAKVTDYHWVIKDVPAMKEESYTSTVKNHITKIEFQLSASSSPLQFHDYMGTWSQLADDLLKSEYFGQQLNKDNGWLDDITNPLTKEVSDKLEKAKKIFAYVRDNFTCTNHSDVYIDQTLRNVVKTRNGTVSEINLLLIAMLKHEGIDTDPVILSTREHGYIYSLYPLITRFNYVVAKAIIGNTEYMLDASEPRMGFGHLPFECYNGSARVINNIASSMDLLADSLMERKNSLVFIINDEKGNLSGTMQQTPGYYESLALRDKIKEKGQDQFWKDIKKDFTAEIDINDPALDSLDKYEYPLGIRYNFKLKDEKEDIIYLNPMFGEGYKENPFKSAERVYPVEMPYTSDETYTMQMDVPQGYVIDELPQQMVVKLNDEGDGQFEYRISESNGTIAFRSRIKFNRAYFLPDEYESLREFFNLIVKKQSEQIVFKKKK